MNQPQQGNHLVTYILYLSANLFRMFYKGRTETIRPVSEFSCQFTRLFDDPSAKPEDKKSALKKAIGYSR